MAMLVLAWGIGRGGKPGGGAGCEGVEAEGAIEAEAEGEGEGWPSDNTGT